jgi:alpha-L-fucosidase
MMEKKMPREMTGAELRSMLKSNVNFKSLGGIKIEGLKLKPEDMQWWRDAKIGFFIHWGLYSILGRGEWVRHREKLPWDEYKALADEFDPQNFEMSEWAELAADFGAKYAVMVTRHHDGFSLWDSEGSYEGFTSAKTASGRDFVREYAEAFREKGLKVGFYYSPMDWRFEGYFDPEGKPESAALLKKQCYAQVEELCTKYGTVDILWYDGGWLAHKGSDTSSAWFWEPGKLNTMVRGFQPKAVINPRSGWEGDFYCDEGSRVVNGGIIPVPWEKCMCVNSGASWGWMAEDPVSDFDDLIRMMVNVVCRDGNWLLNVAPDRDGKLSDEVTGRMREIGAWLKKYGESVYGTRGGLFEPVDGVFGSTYKGNVIYVHILDREAFKTTTIPDIPERLVNCSLLDGGAFVEFTQDGDGIQIMLPDGAPDAPDIIVKVELDREIRRDDNSDVYFTGKE